MFNSADFDSAIELFPAASYQYVMYGMVFKPDFDQQGYLSQHFQQAQRIIQQNRQLTEQMLRTLPAHREYIENISSDGCRVAIPLPGHD